ncbi:hypothetical protein V5O48_010658 [Marasmius crinis-equi]|uniref:F-box domain-containing protein n=1 Tax=Marasmius crinis-equi TaxID=585013 RepID=A0ABR3F7S9_9AGAR
MDRLPTETLCVIFNLSVFQDASNANIETKADITEGRTWPCIMDLSSGPWSVSRVCTRWRAITTSLPSLWSRFLLSTKDLALERKKDPNQMFERWLTLSGTSKLSFLIQTDGVCNVGTPDLFHTLIGHADRWERIEIINSSYAFWSRLHHRGVKHHLRSLKSVTFLAEDDNHSYIHDGYQDPFNYSYYSLFEQAPCLHSLINRDYFALFDIPMPWEQLTEYEGSHRISYLDHLSVLHKTPNLTFCTLAIDYDQFHSPESDIDQKSLTLPKLRTLRVKLFTSDAETADFSSRIRSMSLPFLQSLSIETDGSPMVTPYDAFAEALRSSSAILQRLELSGNDADPECVIGLLRASSSVSFLSLGILDTDRVSDLLNTVIGRLGVEENDEIFLPHLHTLELKLPGTFSIRDVDFTVLASVIRTRRNTASGGIRNLELLFGEEAIEYECRLLSFEPNMLPPRLEVLQEEGLSIAVRVSSDVKED